MKHEKRPDQATVLFRAYCLSALVLRMTLELLVKVVSEPEFFKKQEQNLKSLHQWMEKERITPCLTPKERRMIFSDLGNWTPQDVIYADFRPEALGTLLWALNLFPQLPSYDQEFSREEIFQVFSPLKEEKEWLDRITLRSEEEIQQAFERAEIWYWRANTTHRLLRKDPILLRQGYFQEIVSTLQKAIQQGMLDDPLLKGDLLAFGKAYFQLTGPEYSKACSIVLERHFALKWLLALEKEWI